MIDSRLWRYGMTGGLVLGGLMFGCAMAAPAQEDTAPVVPADSHAATASAAVLNRLVSVSLDHVPLEQALTTIAGAAHLSLTYSTTQLPPGKMVSLTANAISVGEAFDRCLQGTGLEVIVSANGRARIRPTVAGSPMSEALQQGATTISGYVRDSVTGASIPQAAVRVDGTALQVTSGSDGHYQVAGIAAGEYRVTVRRVGYIAKTRTVTVVDGETKKLDFALNPPVTQLNEVVTTALGTQRRYEVGNVISTINVDSLSPTAPVTSVTDLIAGRAPGVEVVENSGLVGSGESIRIRGLSSLLLQGDPIVIVDGVREDNTGEGMAICGPGATQCGGGGVPSPNRLNDLDFMQIATIDILKGPAAVTEYGTDAANGVIVITTKRGNAGPPQWHVFAEQSAAVVPTNFPNYYYSWGHYSSGTHQTSVCPLVPLYGGSDAQYGAPYNSGAVFGTCVADSVTDFNPLNHAATTIYGTGPSGKYDLNASGGSDAFRYFFGGGLSNATGGTHVPDVFRSEATNLGVPESDLKPNGENQRSVRVNSSLRLSATSDVQFNVAYLSTYQETPGTSGLGFGPTVGPTIGDSVHDYGYAPTYYGESPLYMLGEPASQETDQLIGGMTASWRPAGWLAAHGTVGLDHESQRVSREDLPQTDVVYTNNTSNGSLLISDGGTDIYTANLVASATASLSRNLRAVTSIGVQLADTRSQGVTSVGYGLSGISFALSSAVNSQTTENTSRLATLGGYLEEQLDFMNRLFLIGAVRVDAGSGFGRSYSTQTYPKVSMSWLAINTTSMSVRLRGALGGSGLQPPYGATFQEYYASTAFVNGQEVPGYSLAQVANPTLQPERELEYEGGIDVSLWQNRLTAELTGYSKTTQNAVYGLPLGFDASYTYYNNLGDVRNTGFEATVTATVLDSRQVTWTMTLNSSVDGNKLVQFSRQFAIFGSGDGQSAGGSGLQRFAVGYPIYGYWGAPIHYVDRNHDGILMPNEVSFDSAVTYQGSSIPGEETSWSSYLGLWRGTLAIGVAFDYKTGYKLYNGADLEAATNAVGHDQNLLPATLWEQAKEQYAPFYDNVFATSADYEDGTFLRFRELSVTYALPARWARAARMTTLSVTASVRNLVLWTRYAGDPEAGGVAPGFATSTQATTGASVINSNLRGDAGNVPLMRSWNVVLNVGL